MCGFKSFDTIKKNSKIWAQNLPKPKRNQKRFYPRIKTLNDFIRLPLKTYFWLIHYFVNL